MALTIQNSLSVNAYNPFVSSGSSYLVDNYSPVVAYTLQKISSTQTNVIRVRRDSDNAEIDVSASDITDGTLATWSAATDSHVTTWYDQSGNVNNLIQTTAGGQPRIVTAGVVETTNGIPSVKFVSGWTHSMSHTTPIINQINTSSFIVSSNDSTNATGTVFHSSTTTSQGFKMYVDRSACAYNTILQNTVPTNYIANLSVIRNDSNIRLTSIFVDSLKLMSSFDNGSTGGTNTFTGSFVSDGMIIGQTTGGFSKLIGSISEIIIMNTDETSNRSAIETNINDRYTIY